jgi:hypothetical protein
MKTRPLGSGGLSVSQVGLGGMYLSMRRLVCNSRCVASQTGTGIGGSSGSTRRTRGSASPTSSITMQMPPSHDFT